MGLELKLQPEIGMELKSYLEMGPELKPWPKISARGKVTAQDVARDELTTQTGTGAKERRGLRLGQSQRQSTNITTAAVAAQDGVGVEITA